MRKINIDTDLRLALTGAIRTLLWNNKSEFDPVKYLAPGIDAMSAVCKDRVERFQSAGHAAKIKAIPMSEMAKRYEAGVY